MGDLLFVVEHEPEDIVLTRSDNLLPGRIDDFLHRQYSIHENYPFTVIDLMDLKETFKTLLESQFHNGDRIVSQNYSKDIKLWMASGDECIVKLPVIPKDKNIETKGIAKKFAQIRTTKEALSFAKKYGLLSCLVGHASSYSRNAYCFTVFEPVDIWLKQAQRVSQLLRVYKAIIIKRHGGKIDIIGDYVEIKEDDIFYKVYLKGSKYVDLVLYKNQVRVDDSFDEKIGMSILSNCIREALSKGIDLDFSRIIQDKNTKIGFRIQQRYRTSYLLAAIYYDLWRMITESEPIEFCAYCGRPFTKKGRRIYCSDSCRVMACRAKNESSVPKKIISSTYPNLLP